MTAKPTPSSTPAPTASPQASQSPSLPPASQSPLAPENGSTTAMQAALAGEHACIYGYGIVGAQLPGDAAAAHDALAEHRARRDALTKLLRAAGTEPVAALSSYTLSSPVTGTATAWALAVRMEQRIAALYADLVAAADSAELRTLAVHAMVDASRQIVLAGGTVDAFPGLDGRLAAG